MSMNIFSLFRPQFYKPLWTYKVGGYVWRVLFSETRCIAGEDRSEKEKVVTFFALDRITGDVLWEKKRIGDEWWTTIEGIYGPNIYLHAFAKPDLPHPQHITAIDLRTGEVLWEYPDLTFLYVKDGSVVAEKKLFEKSTVFRLNELTGEIKSEIDDQKAVEREKLEVRGNDPHLKLTFPEVYNSQLPSHRDFKDIVEKKRKEEQLIEPVEVRPENDNLIICYHKLKRGKVADKMPYMQELQIYRRDNHKLIFNEVLMNSATAPAPDGFLLRDGFLYYIKNRTEIVGISLEISL